MSIDVARDCGGAAEVQTSFMCMCAQCVRFFAIGNSNAVFFFAGLPFVCQCVKQMTACCSHSVDCACENLKKDLTL